MRLKRVQTYMFFSKKEFRHACLFIRCTFIKLLWQERKKHINTHIHKFNIYTLS